MKIRVRPAVAAGLAGATVLGLAGAAFAGGPAAKSEHWGVIDRNTIGSPVVALRDGPFAIAPSGLPTAPPFGNGSLGIEVGSSQEKVAFGNEQDFLGDPVSGLSAVGFQVFQTGEDATPNQANMPNITFEIDPHVDNRTYTSMVWVPAANTYQDQWSPYLDATTTGQWYFTGDTGAVTGCNLTTMCSFTDAKAALADKNDGMGSAATILSAAVEKGRDSAWQGAVDGLRINDKVYDFEADGVHPANAKK